MFSPENQMRGFCENEDFEKIPVRKQMQSVCQSVQESIFLSENHPPEMGVWESTKVLGAHAQLISRYISTRPY